MAKRPAQTKKSSDIPFEENLEQLEQIVADLESGTLSLDDALARYEQGVKRLRRCHEALAQAERKIELLAGVRADGTPITESFEEADVSLEKKRTSRSQRRSTEAIDDVDEAPRLF